MAVNQMDLSQFDAPYQVHAPSLGPILVSARTAAFYDWFDSEDQSRPWADGRAFVRMLLTDFTRLATGEGPSAEAVGCLTDTELDTIAVAILNLAGTSAEAETTPEFDNGGSDRLLNYLRLRGANRAARRDQVKNAVEKAAIRASGFQPPGSAVSAISSNLDPLHGASAWQEWQRQGPAIQAAFDQLKEHGSTIQGAWEELQRKGPAIQAAYHQLKNHGSAVQAALEQIRGVDLSNFAREFAAVNKAYSSIRDGLSAHARPRFSRQSASATLRVRERSLSQSAAGLRCVASKPEPIVRPWPFGRNPRCCIVDRRRSSRRA
ncbi:hypothetical protein AAFG13_36620 [Bradyrhizobium sp. B124]|uniref:hypothetical protein n=1 Tax=Bradyrhizobium sp. B124 TaxID=3140245 RepID=UPI003183AC4F